MLRWPGRDEVEGALRRWAERVARGNPAVLKVGYFGSYARGDWGVGSDLDVVIVVRHTDKPFIRRAVDFPFEDLPVPADLLVYTEKEWEGSQGKFKETISRETVWVYERSV